MTLIITSTTEPLSTHLYDPTELVRMRSALHDGTADARATRCQAALLRDAAALLPFNDTTPWSFSAGPWSVVNKSLVLNTSTGGPTLHDYVSIGIYNHPCNALPDGCTPYPGGHLLPPAQCDNSTGLPWEACDGQRNEHAIAEGDSPRQSAMADAVKMLARAAFFCATPNASEANTAANNASCAGPFAARASLLLDTWFLNPTTAMKPNLSYGQIIPSDQQVKPGHGGFIEWAHMAELLDAVALLRVVTVA